MRSIPLVAVPNQSLSVVLGGARWDIRIRIATNIMVADIRREGEPIVLGQRLVPGEPIIPYRYLLTGGEYVNYGITTLNDEYPWWRQFGVTQFLVAIEVGDGEGLDEVERVWPPLAYIPIPPYEGPSLELEFYRNRYLIGPIGERPEMASFSDIITFTRASQATYVDALGRIQTADIDEPRLDYDPVTGQPLGILMERAATNLARSSGDLLGVGWNAGSGVTRIPDAAVLNPDGSESVRLDLSGAAGHAVTQNIPGPLALGVPHTISVWIRQGSGESYAFQVAYYDGGTNLNSTTIQTGGLADWTRIQFTFIPTEEAASPQLRLNGHSNGADGDSVYVWGAQLETGSTASSYIPTEGSPATRAADQASVLDLTDWYNPEQGTLLVELVAGGTTPNVGSIVSLQAVSGPSNRLELLKTTGGNLAFYATGSGSGGPTTSTGSFDPEATYRLAFTYPLPTAVARDGELHGPAPATSEPINSISELAIGGRAAATGMNGHIRKVLYFPRRLTDEQLQALTL